MIFSAAAAAVVVVVVRFVVFVVSLSEAAPVPPGRRVTFLLAQKSHQKMPHKPIWPSGVGGLGTAVPGASPSV